VLRCVFSPDEDAVGLVLPLDGRMHEVGRGELTLRRIRDRRMARRHFRLEPGADGGYRIRDLASERGTWMDGRRVRGVAPFDADVLAAGGTLFVRDQPPEALSVDAQDDAPEASSVFGVSSTARALWSAIASIAPSPEPVLITGATGVGKEVAAAALHDRSGRRGAFVVVNCAATPSDLAKIELFGEQTDGASSSDRIGSFEEANGGTLVLDEVGDLPSHVQRDLLRALETSSIRPVGSNMPRQVDVRIVATTHLDLGATSFAADLLERLGQHILHVPPLTERKADILDLWDRFLGKPRPAPETTAAAREALLLYDWPMNVRELKRLARQTAELARPGEPLDVDVLPRDLRARLETRERFDLDRRPPRIDDANTPGYHVLVRALEATHGNVKRAAHQNGWHRTQLYRWLRRLDIDPDTFRN
jgi:DNA-binding NtrC family response regulator